jgi:hypothetical protein
MNETVLKRSLSQAVLRGVILTFVTAATLAAGGMAQAGQSLTMAWNSVAGAAGYVIHYGNQGTNFNQSVDAGKNTTWTVTGLQEGDTDTFVVTAYDANGNVSQPSNQTVYYVPGLVQMGARTQIQQPASLTFAVVPGHTYQVQASTDLQNWVTIWQTIATSNAVVQYQDPAGANMQMRFYRTATF